MRRFLTTVCILSITFISLKMNSGSVCYGAEGYKSTGSYKGAEGYNGAGAAKSTNSNQNNENSQNSQNSQNNNDSDNQQNASDNGEFTPQEREQIMQNAQKWFNENPEQAKILNQLLQNPR